MSTAPGLMTKTENDMLLSIPLFKRFDPSSAKEVAELLKKCGYGPLLFVGSGSSIIFPGKLAVNRAAELLLPYSTVQAHCPEDLKPGNMPSNSYVFLISNSGRTTEIVDVLIPELEREKISYFGITREGSPLAEKCKKYYSLISDAEKVVPATNSIINQALFCDSVIHYLAGRDFQIGQGRLLTDKVADCMAENLRNDISEQIVNWAKNARVVYWVDKGTGVAEELRLKANEILGKPSVYLQGNQIAHGPVEGIGEDDLIVVVGSGSYSDKDMDALRDVAAARKAALVTMEKRDKNLPSLDAKIAEGYEGYSQIPRGWKLLLETCLAMGRNPDNTQYASKYRQK